VLVRVNGKTLVTQGLICNENIFNFSHHTFETMRDRMKVISISSHVLSINDVTNDGVLTCVASFVDRKKPVNVITD